MLIRPKMFFVFLGLCLIPLLLLALINYWNSVRSAEAALRKDLEIDLADFKVEISDHLSQDQNELTRLSRSESLHNYLRTKNEGVAESPAPQSTGKSGTRDLISEANASDTVPVKLRIRVAQVLNRHSHFASISLFDRGRHPLFFAEQGANDANEPINFHTENFLSQQPQPDGRVWTKDAATVLISPVLTAPFGADIDCTVPIIADNDGMDTPQGSLVGELKLDPIFSEAAREITGSPAGLVSTIRRNPVVFIVIDGSGNILYHANEALKHQLVSTSMPYFQQTAIQMFSSENGRQSFTMPGGARYSVAYSRILPLNVWVAVASDRDQALVDAKRMGSIGLVVAIGLGLLAAGLLTLYFQRKARGIERVTEGVEAIARGKLDHRIELRSSDALRPLADNVGLMTEQLREQIAHEAETRQFQSFIRLSAILTHDLKNAIEALSLTVTNMELHFENAEFRQDAMKTVKGATENLKTLVARLSNPVTTLSGEHKRPRPVDLVPMLKRVISVTVEPARVDHEIKVSVPASLLALVDEERMDKVIENLIINALEAISGKSGTLTIEAGTTEAGQPFFSVSDTGDGMSQRFIKERLFHPFATTKKRGVGLGLYTCREVVRAHGGSIEVESREGAGTTFTVVLPSATIDERGANEPHSQSQR